MRLADDWRDILTKAWSVRFWIAAAFFQVAAELLPYLDLPPTLFRVLALLLALAGLCARLIAQKNLNE